MQCVPFKCQLCCRCTSMCKVKHVNILDNTDNLMKPHSAVVTLLETDITKLMGSFVSFHQDMTERQGMSFILRWDIKLSMLQYRDQGLWPCSMQCQEVFLLFRMSRQALRPTQPLARWVQGVKWLGRGAVLAVVLMPLWHVQGQGVGGRISEISDLALQDEVEVFRPRDHCY